MISGFLMALVLSEKYGPEQNRIFYSNRALRIYVPYVLVWCSALLVDMAIFRYGARPNPYISALSALPPLSDFATWGYIGFTNLFIVGQEIGFWLGYDGHLFLTAQNWKVPSPVQYWQVIPQSWTLSLELIFYALAPFLLRRRLRVIVAITAISLLARMIAYEVGMNHDPWTFRFFPFELALFLLGALSYRLYLRVKSTPLLNRSAAHCVSTMIVAIVLLDHDSHIWPLYLVVALSLPFLFLVNQKARWDRLFGDLSYPVYLIHWPVQTAAWTTFAASSKWFAPMSLLATVAAALVLVFAVERPLDRARRRRLSRQPTGPIAPENEPAHAEARCPQRPELAVAGGM
jgi:peptidoglycan/LPS O-acetylase OafA/YrhL